MPPSVHDISSGLLPHDVALRKPIMFIQNQYDVSGCAASSDCNGLEKEPMTAKHSDCLVSAIFRFHICCNVVRKQDFYK